jgi:hypothetical protein
MPNAPAPAKATLMVMGILFVIGFDYFSIKKSIENHGFCYKLDEVDVDEQRKNNR